MAKVKKINEDFDCEYTAERIFELCNEAIARNCQAKANHQDSYAVSGYRFITLMKADDRERMCLALSNIANDFRKAERLPLDLHLALIEANSRQLKRAAAVIRGR